MDLSTDTDFLSGALQLLTGVRIVSQGKDGGEAAGSFDHPGERQQGIQATLWLDKDRPRSQSEVQV